MVAKKKPAKRYPPLPSEIDAPAGRVIIELVENLGDTKDETVMGHFDMLTRTIRIKKKMARERQHFTLFHEKVHLWLADSGLQNGLNGDMEEAICDAVASGLMREKFG